MENKTNFKVGDQVLVSPQVTGEKEWIEATIIEVKPICWNCYYSRNR